MTVRLPDACSSHLHGRVHTLPVSVTSCTNQARGFKVRLLGNWCRVAKQGGLTQHAAEAREAYLKWLEATGQLQLLAQLAQAEGRLDEALDLYLAATKPAEACQVRPREHVW